MKPDEIDRTIDTVIASFELAMKHEPSPGVRDVLLFAHAVRAMRREQNVNSDPIDRPSFNHTRADGPFNPCPECLGKISRAQLIALVKDLQACAKDHEEDRERIRMLEDGLGEALRHLNEHGAEYHHVTPPDVIKRLHALRAG